MTCHKKSPTKSAINKINAARPPAGKGAGAGGSRRGIGSSVALGLTTAAAPGGTRNIGQFCIAFTATTPATVEQMVARKAVPTMAVGSCACCEARMAMAVVGRS